ncbi:MAG: type II secretion system protein [Elusimicrobia bacterium]|nr:type II secretion system protein [Elusimicrobiota bacterium]
MLVVAIIGLLSAIAIPKFGALVNKAKEAELRGRVGGIRSALSLYYVDNEAIYPTVDFILSIPILGFPTLEGTLKPKYIEDNVSFLFGVPGIHGNGSTNIEIVNPWSPDGPGPVADTGAIYWRANANSATGRPATQALLRVACSHTDSRGTTWSRW